MARILIVDDSSTMRALLRVILETAGHDVVSTADNGADGLRLAEELLPDLLMLDMLMPRMDGVQVLQRLREKHPRARAIMISSVSSLAKVKAAREAGFFHYVLKPFEPARLLAVVTAALAPEKADQATA